MAGPPGNIFESKTFKFLAFCGVGATAIVATAIGTGGFGVGITEGAKLLPKDEGTKPGGDRPAATASPFPKHTAAPKKTGSSSKESTKPKSTPNTASKAPVQTPASTIGPIVTKGLLGKIENFAQTMEPIDLTGLHTITLRGRDAAAEEQKVVAAAKADGTMNGLGRACLAWAKIDVASSSAEGSAAQSTILLAAQGKPAFYNGQTHDQAWFISQAIDLCGKSVEQYANDRDNSDKGLNFLADS